MTEAGRQSLSAGWQTGLVLIGTAAAGRWLAGAGFGYTLFAVVWGPLACGRVSSAEGGWQSIALRLASVLVFALPWLEGRPIVTALHLAGWLTLFVGVNLAATRLLTLFRLPVFGVTTAIWLLWILVPLLMTRSVVNCVGDPSTAFILGQNPVLVANAADTSAGDWTHQNVAYSTLTRLGQDIPFDWPGRSAVLFYAVTAISAFVVPRGTSVIRFRATEPIVIGTFESNHRDEQLFHVEQPSNEASERPLSAIGYSAESVTPHRRMSSSNSSSDR